MWHASDTWERATLESPSSGVFFPIFFPFEEEEALPALETLGLSPPVVEEDLDFFTVPGARDSGSDSSTGKPDGLGTLSGSCPGGC